MNLSQKIEAYLFYTGEPVSMKKLSIIFEADISDPSDLEIAIAEIDQALAGRGIILMKNADEVQLATHPEMGDIIMAIKKQELSDPLSKSALETLTIILYKNGATKPEIWFWSDVPSSPWSAVGLPTAMLKNLTKWLMPFANW
jgi:chromosome segregation and condensation protein ScpB